SKSTHPETYRTVSSATSSGMENRYGATTPSLTSSAGDPTSSHARSARPLMMATATAANGPTTKTDTAIAGSATDRIVSTEANLVCRAASGPGKINDRPPRGR